MTKRYQLVSPRPKKDGGTYWHPIGTAWAKDNGSFSLVFDSLPIADKEGRVMVLMSEPLEPRDGNGTRQQSARQASYDAQRPSGAPVGGGFADFPDEVPFAPCTLL